MVKKKQTKNTSLRNKKNTLNEPIEPIKELNGFSIIPSDVPYINGALKKHKNNEPLEDKEIETLIDFLINPLTNAWKEWEIIQNLKTNKYVNENVITAYLGKKCNYKGIKATLQEERELQREIKQTAVFNTDTRIFRCVYCGYEHSPEELFVSCVCRGCEKEGKENKKCFKFTNKHIINSIFIYIEENYNIITFKDDKNQINILYYNEEKGLYEDIILLLVEIGEKFNLLWTTLIEKEIKIKLRNSSKLIEEKEINPPHLIATNNKVLYFNEDTKEIEIKPFSSEYYITIKLKWDYKIPTNSNESPCPVFENEYLKEVIEPEWVPVIWDLFGYSLWKTQMLKKYVVMQGETNSGKTQLANVLLKLFEGQTAKVSIKQLVKEDYSFVYLLKNALINITSDENQQGLLKNALQILKNIVGGDGLPSRKHYGMGEDINVYTLFFIVCNKMYRLDLNDKATLNRIILLVFPYEFVDNPIYSFQKKKDVNIFNKMTTKEEMEGILYLAVERAKYLFKKRRFQLPINEEEMFKKIENVENPIERYWKHLIEYKVGARAVLVEIQERFINSKRIFEIQDDKRIDDYTEFKKTIHDILNKYVQSEGLGEEVEIGRGRITKDMYTDNFEKNERGLIVKDFQLKQNWVSKYKELFEKQRMDYKEEEKPKTLAEKQYDAKQRRNYGKGKFQSMNEELTDCFKGCGK